MYYKNHRDYYHRIDFFGKTLAFHCWVHLLPGALCGGSRKRDIVSFCSEEHTGLLSFSAKNRPAVSFFINSSALKTYAVSPERKEKEVPPKKAV